MIGLTFACGHDTKTLSDGTKIEIASDSGWYAKSILNLVCALVAFGIVAAATEEALVAALVAIGVVFGLTYLGVPASTKPSTKSLQAIKAAEAALSTKKTQSEDRDPGVLELARTERDSLTTRLREKIAPYIQKMEAKRLDAVVKFRRGLPLLVRLKIATHEGLTRSAGRNESQVRSADERADYLKIQALNLTLGDAALFKQTVEYFRTAEFKGKADLQRLESLILRLETLDESAAIDPDSRKRLTIAIQRARKAATQKLSPVDLENVSTQAASIFALEMASTMKAESEL